MTKKNTLIVYVSIAAETIATKNFIEAKEFSEKALSLIPRGEITEHARKIIEMIEMHSGPKKISSSPISRKELEKVYYGPWYIPSKWVNGPDYLPTPGPS